MAFVPAYSAFASRVDRMRLVFGVTAFFVANIVLFALAVHAGVDHVGVFYYVWVGLFSCRSSRSSGRTRTTSTPRTPAAASFPSSPSA